jgi:hypothetical protein
MIEISFAKYGDTLFIGSTGVMELRQEIQNWLKANNIEFTIAYRIDQCEVVKYNPYKRYVMHWYSNGFILDLNKPDYEMLFKLMWL